MQRDTGDTLRLDSVQVELIVILQISQQHTELRIWKTHSPDPHRLWTLTILEHNVVPEQQNGEHQLHLGCGEETSWADRKKVS